MGASIVMSAAPSRPTETRNRLTVWHTGASTSNAIDRVGRGNPRKLLWSGKRLIRCPEAAVRRPRKTLLRTSGKLLFSTPSAVRLLGALERSVDRSLDHRKEYRADDFREPGSTAIDRNSKLRSCTHPPGGAGRCQDRFGPSGQPGIPASQAWTGINHLLQPRGSLYRCRRAVGE